MFGTGEVTIKDKPSLKGVFYNNRLVEGHIDENGCGSGRMTSIDGDVYEGVFDHGVLMRGKQVK